ncbi:MAG: 2-deoxy-D-gluconate 3-dehydrogenase [Henriciella sp.]|jgi:NAD(P)-dependent dehydrogenase (short-subunit alcohol dehydrogenase family)|uniref:SDR family NAD(P)-dependent oxidoreductase n=1 Tax=Henriciella sp. TaxID=1968823 RepID=UPI000C11C3BC|nr:glucose 1-dehydrogenase [Henriciella sp.]MAN73719.1 2-deoxy-D-gluconate 3-dehydrogenase [Henriciella sp.]MBF35094.1 2-deoxy-D-gluconate 3-dehydrogenase [Hyphomonadaceae bacterium]PHR75311.1 MAG: 2-deoxy-D-gluconate 3-dehydrogenase [Henriciella sp.]|tara:strand:+ start:1733 stop:2500 length:768 start_codon:yes stop_codon:yes gene_type:complete
MELFDLTGKTALITGASGGLGGSFARGLSEAGATVVLAARRLEKLEALAGEIKSAGGKALAVSMDVTDPASVEAAFKTVQDELGGPADIIVNNSGISRDNWFTQMTEEDWRAVMDCNLDGVWRVAKAGANALMEAGKPGSIINIASITAKRPQYTIAAYAASKAAVEHFTRVMALELARYGIRANALAPGYFKTDINDEFLESEPGDKMRKRIPMRRFGDHKELTGALLLLASDAGSYMTGTTIAVDGGHLVSTL